MLNGLRIIGLSGTNGSGKDTVGHMLAERHNFLFVSVTDLLRDEAKRRGQPIEREVLRTISAEWRRESGLGVLIDKAVAAYEKVSDAHDGLAISSLRNPGEADRVHELGGQVIWVDADPQIRYKRIQSVNRGRSGEDNKTFQQFLAEEEIEMHSSGDAATLDVLAVKDLSDVFLKNDSADIDDFKSYAERELGLAK